MAIKKLALTVKRLFISLVALSLIAVFAFFTHYHIFPFVYRIKEPFFIMPIETTGIIATRADLPIRNDEYGDGEFGAKRRSGRRHKGIDLAAELRSPVFASKSGWARSFSLKGGYGNLIVIDHPGEWQTRYGHLYQSNIKRLQWVHQGQTIGLVGKSGNADLKGIEPHLHFEIRFKAKPIDPAVELVRN